MEEIIGVQGGDSAVSPDDIPVGEYTATVTAPKDGYIVRLSNSAIKKIAFAAGAPKHKVSGVYLHKKLGDYCAKDDELMTIYSNSEGRLTEAQQLLLVKTKPIEELYDLQADPHELKNLAQSPQHHKTLNELRFLLDEWIANMKDKGLAQAQTSKKPDAGDGY